MPLAGTAKKQCKVQEQSLCNEHNGRRLYILSLFPLPRIDGRGTTDSPPTMLSSPGSMPADCLGKKIR